MKLRVLLLLVSVWNAALVARAVPPDLASPESSSSSSAAHSNAWSGPEFGEHELLHIPAGQRTWVPWAQLLRPEPGEVTSRESPLAPRRARKGPRAIRFRMSSQPPPTLEFGVSTTSASAAAAAAVKPPKSQGSSRAGMARPDKRGARTPFEVGSAPPPSEIDVTPYMLRLGGSRKSLGKLDQIIEPAKCDEPGRAARWVQRANFGRACHRLSQLYQFPHSDPRGYRDRLRTRVKSFWKKQYPENPLVAEIMGQERVAGMKHLDAKRGGGATKRPRPDGPSVGAQKYGRVDGGGSRRGKAPQRSDDVRSAESTSPE